MVCVKLLHLSDLHIGKRVNECSMLEDQRYILEQIAQLAIERKVDGVLLAGDLYDKPVPPAEAVILLDTFFTALSQAGIPVFAISGNHDSPERLSFGARLLTGNRHLFVCGLSGASGTCSFAGCLWRSGHLSAALFEAGSRAPFCAGSGDCHLPGCRFLRAPAMDSAPIAAQCSGGASVCHRGDHQRIRGTFGRRVGPGEWRTV